jgi:hypothetical protein
MEPEFTDRNYKPAPDGLFTFDVVNINELDVDNISKIKIEFSGSYIPHSTSDMLWMDE